MRRRALLALGALGLAGCVDGPAGSDSPTDSPPDSPTQSPTEPPTQTPAGTPPDIGVQPAESDCPAASDAVRVVCEPEADPDSVPLALTADTRSATLPATLTFTLTNESDATFSTNFYDWSLWKRVDGEWFHIVPDAIQQPLMHLEPSDSHEWDFTAEHEQPLGPNRRYYSWERSGTVGGLGGGEYAFTTDGWFREGSYDATTTFGVLLSFDAPALVLEPTARVTGHSRDGDTVTVRGEGSDSENTRRAELALTRVAEGEGTDPRVVIPEQAVYDYRLRNTLPYFESGVETVRYVADDATLPAFGVHEPYTIRYEREPFRVSASVLETETETA
jgi:hypothetical protein